VNSAKVNGGESPVVQVVLEIVRRHPVRAQTRPDQPGGAGREVEELEERPEDAEGSRAREEVAGQMV